MMRAGVVLVILWFVPQVRAAITAAELMDQARDTVVVPSASAALQARTRLQGLIERYPDMQFGSKVSRTRTASDGLAIYHVRLDQLRAFSDKSVATDLMTPTGRAHWQVYYPAGPNVVTLSSLEVVEGPTGWTMARMGGASYAESIWNAVEDADRPAEVILVQIPALALHFIGFVRSGKLYLSLIAGDPGLPVKEHQPERAEKILLALVPLAQSHNGRTN